MNLSFVVTARVAVLLELLSGARYGALLVRRIREKTAGRVDLKSGSLYPTIQQLFREGLIDGGKRLTPSGEAQAHYYRETIALLIGLPIVCEHSDPKAARKRPFKVDDSGAPKSRARCGRCNKALSKCRCADLVWKDLAKQDAARLRRRRALKR